MFELKLVNLAAKVYNKAVAKAKASLDKKAASNDNAKSKAEAKRDRLFDVSIQIVNYANNKAKKANLKHRSKQIELDAAKEALDNTKRIWSV